MNIKLKPIYNVKVNSDTRDAHVTNVQWLMLKENSHIAIKLQLDNMIITYGITEVTEILNKLIKSHNDTQGVL